MNPAYAVDLFKATGKILENVTADDYEASDLDDRQKVIAAVIDLLHGPPGRPLFQQFGPVGYLENAILSWNSVVPADVAAYGELKASLTP